MLLLNVGPRMIGGQHGDPMGDVSKLADVVHNLSQRRHQALTAERGELYALLQGQPLEVLLAAPRPTSAQKELLRQPLGRRPTT